ncbi:MAG: hypothetical protein BM485_02400 [Desulfobulbaceae bacterium DB1]|nr:MAG: hypothetical protein BM485_02400 [Desulfobulbaceae bacterium DB1]
MPFSVRCGIACFPIPQKQKINKSRFGECEIPLKTVTYTYDEAGRMTGLTQFNITVAACTHDNANG